MNGVHGTLLITMPITKKPECIFFFWVQSYILTQRAAKSVRPNITKTKIVAITRVAANIFFI
jgi:hypothetical protein